MSRRFDFGLFRAQRNVDGPRQPRKSTDRWPGNVPFLVDNLWEWHRALQFGSYPSRRQSVFAHARRKLSEEYAADNPGDGMTVYRVILVDAFKLCQLHNHLRDARDHPDCKNLPALVKRVLSEQGLTADGGWAAAATPTDRQQVGRLWTPGLTAGEVQTLAGQNAEVQRLLETVEPAITFWRTVRFVDETTCGSGPWFSVLSGDGEIFFDPTGGCYELEVA
jgi:hypothetical protein